MVKRSFDLPEKIFDQHSIVLGKTRSGKSSKMRRMCEHHLHQHEPVTIIDPKGDWWGIKSSADGKKPGYAVVIFGGEHADVPINEHSGAQVAELVATGNRPALIDLSEFMVGERTRFFIAFASTFFKLARGRRFLYIDEVHNFAPQGKILDVDAGKMLHWANRLASEGSGKGITLIAASQRPQKVHKDFVTSCETLIACRVIHKLDRDAIKDWIDGCADPTIGKEVLQGLAGMQREESWVWSPEIDFGPKKIVWPMFETYDSFKPRTGTVKKLRGWATVDLEEVKGKLAQAVEEAKANDPTELRREVARLKQTLKRADEKMGRTIPPDREAEIRKHAYVLGQQEALQELLKNVPQFIETILTRRIDWTIREAVKDSRTLLDKFFSSKQYPRRTPRLKQDPPSVADRKRVENLEHARAVKSVAGVEIKRAGNGSEHGISGPQQKILDRLLWLEDHGIAPARKETLAAVSGVSPNSGSYFNNLGALRSARLIDYPTPGEVCFTETGRARAEPVNDSRPIHLHWLDIVTGPQQNILKHLLTVHPHVPSKEALAEAIGVSSNSGSYFNNLGRLRMLGAIDYPTKGTVALTKHVMP